MLRSIPRTQPPNSMRLVCLAALAALVASPAAAQPSAPHAASRLSLGVRAGALATSTTVEYDMERSDGPGDLGIGASGVAEFVLAPPLVAAVELGAARRRYQRTLCDPSRIPDGGCATTRSSLDVLVAGATVQFHPYDRRRVSPYWTAGPRVEVLVRRAAATVTDGGVTARDGSAERFHTVVVGATAGVGLRVAPTTTGPAVSLEARYTRTLRSASPAPFPTVIRGADVGIVVTW